MLNTLIQWDCLIEMKKIPDKSIDLVLTDPPYWIGIDWQKASASFNSKHNRKAHAFKGWDLWIPPKEYFDEIFRISKNQIIWWGNYFVDYLTEWHKGWLMWDKGQHGLTMSDWELAYTSFDTPLRIFTLNRVHIQTDGSVHPTQKPLELFRWCIDMFTKPWDTVLDCFAWSWTTWIVCAETWRNYILIEKDPDYCKIIERRLKATTPPLFVM